MKCVTPIALVLLLLDWVQRVVAQENFYFWKLGHMDGPHTSSKALGISRDGKVGVGATDVVGNLHGWRLDIDWAIATDDGVPPLYNELQVQEDVGVVQPSRTSIAFSASDMMYDPVDYDKVELNLDWGGSTVVGALHIGEVCYSIQWLLPVLDSVDDGDYVTIPDFGGGISDMEGKDVSADGLIMVGYGTTRRGKQAFYAKMNVTDSDGVPIVKDLTIQDAYDFKKLRSSSAMAVSNNGTIIIGYGSTTTEVLPFVTTVLDADTDPITLESTILPKLAGGKYAKAYAMTPDGSIIAGCCDSTKGPIACIWFWDEVTNGWVVKGLGALSHRAKNSCATGIALRPGSAVGEIIVVGFSNTVQEVSEAFVWTGNPVVEDDEVGYFYDLEYILTKTGVGEASGMGSDWVLTEATGISSSGDRIVGWGVNPEGGIEAWLVTGYPYDELVFTHE